jgi:hypothetical protein
MQDRKDFQNLIKELEDKKIIERSKFQWLNPVVFLREKNGNLRSCLDFRKLNDLVDLNGFEIPKVKELITLLDGKNISVV